MLMTSRTIFTPRHRRAFLRSVAFSCLVLSTDGWAQSARPSQTLDPVVVQPSATPPNARSVRRGTATRAARLRQQRNVAANPGTPLATPTGPAFAAPTLNLTGASTAGSRLGLTRLQTPASVEVISAETIAERGQKNILGRGDAKRHRLHGEPGTGQWRRLVQYPRLHRPRVRDDVV
jgi:iron complex outermembrane receptor protein